MMIKQISAAQTWPIRHQVMWPDQPFEYVKLEEDDNGIHFGLFEDTDLRSIVSLFIKSNEAQFRKLATLEAYQGRGYASQLIEHLITFCKQRKVKRLWCNARTSKSSFYQKFGFEETSIRFTKKGEYYVIMERAI
ncbi:MAG: GNAT family N-acetyltransferase [Cytophagales bacterium CG12_big_fil_rev_8_21_14_0_65_40_12]|nr:MAG: GNAT family N-acetyltransferase [Cytophagales bacterium CG12_big_fil_rev_8_21_14_0_65_40_12]PIW05336.1 MAG: GNAT family N-acetyltransferase [Cytophagales bacterium CG17_big_fil_post_rev_8_21_14_2_50_40_13]